MDRGTTVSEVFQALRLRGRQRRGQEVDRNLDFAECRNADMFIGEFLARGDPGWS